MTALVGRQVKRTFSGVVANSTGLPGQCTLKANRQDFADFSYVFEASIYFGGGSHRRKKPSCSQVV
jgi:hypothetical protein